MVAHVQTAVADDGINGASSGFISTISKAWGANLTAGNFGYLWVWAGINSLDDSGRWVISDTQGNGWIRQQSDSETSFSPGPSTGSTQCLFICRKLIGGATTVTITFPSPLRSYARLCMGEFSGVYQLGPTTLDYNFHASVVGTDTVTMPTVSCRQEDMIVSCVQNLTGSSRYLVGTGYSNFNRTVNDGYAACETKQSVAITTDTPKFSLDLGPGQDYGMSFTLEATHLASDTPRPIMGRGATW